QSSSSPKPISTPAGLPWRVMTMRSFSPRCKYLERSSLTSDRATFFIFALLFQIWLARLGPPPIHLRFWHDGENLDGRRRHVIEHAQILDSQAVLLLG